MKYIVLSAIMVLASTPAVAQINRSSPYPTSRQITAAGNNYQLRTRDDGSFPVQNVADRRNVQRVCLTRFKTGNVECRTRAEWERVAARLGAEKR